MAEKQTELSRGTNRRHFLKGSALTAVAAVVDARPSLALTAHLAEAAGRDADERQTGGSAETERAVDLANVLQGTDSTHAFSRGNTLPIAAVPFGMAHWTLQSEARSPWMFQPGA